MSFCGHEIKKSQVVFIDKIEETMFLVSASCLYLFYNQYLVVYFVRLNQLVVQSEVTVNLQNLSGKLLTVNLVCLSIRVFKSVTALCSCVSHPHHC